MITDDHSKLTVAEVEQLRRRWLRRLYPDGLSHKEIADNYSKSPYEYQRVFVEQMTIFLDAGKGNIDFALEQASKVTKEKVLKSCFALRREYPEQFDKSIDELSESVERSIGDMVALYIKPGKFGRFITDVLNSLPDMHKVDDDLRDILEKLEFMLEFKLRAGAEWKKQDYMSHDFFLGYLLGMASPAIDGIKTWDSLAPYYPSIVDQIKSGVQSRNGKNRWGDWPSGMQKWLQERVKDAPKRTTKKSVGMAPTNTKFAKTIVKEAMEYKEKTYGEKWNSEDRAIEWICQTIAVILNKNTL